MHLFAGAPVWRRDHHVTSKHRDPITHRHGVISRNNGTVRFAAVISSKLTNREQIKYGDDISMSSNTYALWCTIYDVYWLLRVSAPRRHPQGVVITEACSWGKIMKFQSNATCIKINTDRCITQESTPYTKKLDFTIGDSFCWPTLLECIICTPWRWSFSGWNML